MPSIGRIQLNARDYGSEIVFEQYAYHGGSSSPSWAVPAWDERGYPLLAGPFSSIDHAVEMFEKEIVGAYELNIISPREVPESLEKEIISNIAVIENKLYSMTTASENLDLTTRGGCNRLNDYVRELAKFTKYLEDRLEKAGSN